MLKLKHPSRKANVSSLHKVGRERYVSQAEEKAYNIKWKVGLKKEYMKHKCRG